MSAAAAAAFSSYFIVVVVLVVFVIVVVLICRPSGDRDGKGGAREMYRAMDGRTSKDNRRAPRRCLGAEAAAAVAVVVGGGLVGDTIRDASEISRFRSFVAPLVRACACACVCASDDDDGRSVDFTTSPI